MYFHVEKSSVAPYPVVATFWVLYHLEVLKLYNWSASYLVLVKIFPIPRFCFQQESFRKRNKFTWGVVALADYDIANDAVTYHELKKSKNIIVEKRIFV